jgi:hypothetical protein
MLALPGYTPLCCASGCERRLTARNAFFCTHAVSGGKRPFWSRRSSSVNSRKARGTLQWTAALLEANPSAGLDLGAVLVLSRRPYPHD